MLSTSTSLLSPPTLFVDLANEDYPHEGCDILRPIRSIAAPPWSVHPVSIWCESRAVHRHNGYKACFYFHLFEWHFYKDLDLFSPLRDWKTRDCFEITQPSVCLEDLKTSKNKNSNCLLLVSFSHLVQRSNAHQRYPLASIRKHQMMRWELWFPPKTERNATTWPAEKSLPKPRSRPKKKSSPVISSCLVVKIEPRPHSSSSLIGSLLPRYSTHCRAVGP